MPRTTTATFPGPCRPVCWRFPRSSPASPSTSGTPPSRTSTIAHKGMVAGAKVLAASILDLLTRPDILQKARAEFDAQLKQTPYFGVLPPDAKRPLQLNK